MPIGVCTIEHDLVDLIFRWQYLNSYIDTIYMPGQEGLLGPDMYM